MVKKQMQLLFKKHSDWIKIVNSFGEDPSISEDLVQEMYIKIQLKQETFLMEMKSIIIIFSKLYVHCS